MLCEVVCEIYQGMQICAGVWSGLLKGFKSLRSVSHLKNMTVSIISNHIFIMHPIFYSKVSKLHYKIPLPASFLLCEYIRPLKTETK